MTFSSNVRRAWLAAVAVGLGSAATACYEDPGVVYGEISRSNQFRYVCDGSAAVGDCTTTAIEFPRAIAQGGLFRLAIDGSSSNEVTSLRPISDEVVGSRPNGQWVCGTEGTAGFVAFDRDGDVVDYVHIPVEAPTSLGVEEYTSATGSSTSRGKGVPVQRVSVPEGKELVVAVVPTGKSGLPLAGALTYAWTTGAEGVATVTALGSPANPSAFVRIAGQKQGTTRLRVEGAGLTTEIEVRVP
ncbi:MAG: hypothetical protein IPK71_36510 [Myxococcales bacterium]|nr:hypothetical protein [Myxococcales bacterium]